MTARDKKIGLALLLLFFLMRGKKEDVPSPGPVTTPDPSKPHPLSDPLSVQVAPDGTETPVTKVPHDPGEVNVNDVRRAPIDHPLNFADPDQSRVVNPSGVIQDSTIAPPGSGSTTVDDGTVDLDRAGIHGFVGAKHKHKHKSKSKVKADGGGGDDDDDDDDGDS